VLLASVFAPWAIGHVPFVVILISFKVNHVSDYFSLTDLAKIGSFRCQSSFVMAIRLP
jgi:hypothetical protein